MMVSAPSGTIAVQILTSVLILTVSHLCYSLQIQQLSVPLWHFFAHGNVQQLPIMIEYNNNWQIQYEHSPIDGIFTGFIVRMAIKTSILL